MAVTHTDAVRNVIADAVVDLIDGGTGAGDLVFRITGSTAAVPTTAVATLPFSATAFGAATGGVATAAAITSDTNAAGGVAAFATLQDGDAVVIAHCSVSATGGGGDIELSTVTIGAGATVSMSALTYTAGA